MFQFDIELSFGEVDFELFDEVVDVERVRCKSAVQQVHGGGVVAGDMDECSKIVRNRDGVFGAVEEKVAKRQDDGERFRVNRLLDLVPTFTREDVVELLARPGLTVSSDLTCGGVERDVTPTPLGSIGADEPRWSGGSFDVTRRICERQRSPLFDTFHRGREDRRRLVPERVVGLKDSALIGEKTKKRIELVHRNFEKAPRPEKQADVSSELAPSPARAVLPRESELFVCLLSELDGFVVQIEVNSTPLARGLNDVFETIFELFSIVDERADGSAAFNENFCIVKNIGEGADEDDVVDDTATDLAFAAGEVDENFSDRLSDFNSLALSHRETIEAVVVTTASEAEEFADVRAVRKLIVPCLEVELDEVSAFVDKVADFNLADEFEFPQCVFAEEIVDVDRVLDRTPSLFVKFDDAEHLAETLDLISRNLSDDAELFELFDITVIQV